MLGGTMVATSGDPRVRTHVSSLVRVAWATGAAAVLGVGLLTVPAHGLSSSTFRLVADAGPVPIPLHEATTSLTQRDISDAGAVVQRHAPVGETVGDGGCVRSAQRCTRGRLVAVCNR